MKFERLKVIEYKGSNEKGASIWKCKCDCGKIILAPGNEIKRGKIKSCGCLAYEKRSEFMKNIIYTKETRFIKCLQCNGKISTNRKSMKFCSSNCCSLNHYYKKKAAYISPQPSNP